MEKKTGTQWSEEYCTGNHSLQWTIALVEEREEKEKDEKEEEEKENNMTAKG